jgi:hypothetical protein
MKNYVILAALVLGFFGGIAPAFGEITVGDNVAFLNFSFSERGESGLDVGTVLNISEDGDWLLIYVPPNDLIAVSKWFIYSDETMANQLLTNLLSPVETYEPTGGDYEANLTGQQQASEDQQLWRPNTVKSSLNPEIQQASEDQQLRFSIPQK